MHVKIQMHVNLKTKTLYKWGELGDVFIALNMILNCIQTHHKDD
jgi:hypothetical protein